MANRYATHIWSPMLTMSHFLNTNKPKIIPAVVPIVPPHEDDFTAMAAAPPMDTPAAPAAPAKPPPYHQLPASATTLQLSTKQPQRLQTPPKSPFLLPLVPLDHRLWPLNQPDRLLTRRILQKLPVWRMRESYGCWYSHCLCLVLPSAF